MSSDILDILQNEIQDDELNQEIANERFQRKTRAFNEITGNFPSDYGCDISFKERYEKGISDDETLSYGEIKFDAVKDIFESIKSNHGGLPSNGVFYDLGSGTGKV